MTRSALLLFIYAVACFRITRLITTDTLTANWRERIRKRGTGEYLKRSIPSGKVVERKVDVVPGAWGFIWRVISCSWCTSIWVAAAVTALAYFEGSWWQWVCAFLTLAAIAGVLGERA